MHAIKKQWNTYTTPVPPRYTHTAVAWNKSMFVFGGQDEKTKFSDMYEYNLPLNQWIKIETKKAPRARSNHKTAVYKDYMVLFGGSEIGFSGKLPKGIRLFSFLDKEWISLPSSKKDSPSGRVGHCLEVIGDKMYVFGGYVHIENNELWCYDFIQRRWNPIIPTGPKPEQRYHASSIAVGNRFYIFAGCGTAVEFNDLYEFNVDTYRWTKIDHVGRIVPHERYNSSAIYYEGGMYIFGGHSRRYYGDCFRFDLLSREWTRIIPSDTRKPLERFCHSCVVIDNYMLVFGGFATGCKYLGDLCILTLGYSSSLTMKHLEKTKHWTDVRIQFSNK